MSEQGLLRQLGVEFWDLQSNATPEHLREHTLQWYSQAGRECRYYDGLVMAPPFAVLPDLLEQLQEEAKRPNLTYGDLLVYILCELEARGIPRPHRSWYNKKDLCPREGTYERHGTYLAPDGSFQELHNTAQGMRGVIAEGELERGYLYKFEDRGTEGGYEDVWTPFCRYVPDPSSYIDYPSIWWVEGDEAGRAKVAQAKAAYEDEQRLFADFAQRAQEIASLYREDMDPFWLDKRYNDATKIFHDLRSQGQTIEGLEAAIAFKAYYEALVNPKRGIRWFFTGVDLRFLTDDLGLTMAQIVETVIITLERATRNIEWIQKRTAQQKAERAALEEEQLRVVEAHNVRAALRKERLENQQCQTGQGLMTITLDPNQVYESNGHEYAEYRTGPRKRPTCHYFRRPLNASPDALWVSIGFQLYYKASEGNKKPYC